MKLFNDLSIGRSRYIKVLTGALFAVFLGAVGSGLWNLLLGPLVGWLSRASLSLTSSLFHGYVNVLYRNVSRNPSEGLTILPFALIVAVIIVLPWVAIVLLARELTRIEKLESAEQEAVDEPTTGARLQDPSRVRRRFVLLWVWVPMALLTTVLYSETLFKTVYSTRAAMFIERSVEIVSPYIDEHERLELRAQFRGIESAADFYRLEDRLRSIPARHSIELPDFKSIR